MNDSNDSPRKDSTMWIVIAIVATVLIVACAVVGVAVLLVALLGISPVPPNF
jgi:hypothetical protein